AARRVRPPARVPRRVPSALPPRPVPSLRPFSPPRRMLQVLLLPVVPSSSSGPLMGNDADVTRVADLGIKIGTMPSGLTASIADVPGVGVGHAAVWRDEPPPPEGRGIARTGVTVIDPGGNLFRSPVPAGGAVLNGAGECTGFLAAAEWGLAETPVFLTSTMQLGRVYDAACELLIEEEPAIGASDVIIPIVAECDDSFLSDAGRMQLTRADVKTALDAARSAAGGPAPA